MVLGHCIGVCLCSESEFDASFHWHVSFVHRPCTALIIHFRPLYSPVSDSPS
jgi:hypothetical protein